MTNRATHTHAKFGTLQRIRTAIRSIGASDGLGAPDRAHTERLRRIPTIPIQ